MSFSPISLVCGGGLLNLFGIYVKRQINHGKHPVYKNERLPSNVLLWPVGIDIDEIEWLPIQLELFEQSAVRE